VREVEGEDWYVETSTFWDEIGGAAQGGHAGSSDFVDWGSWYP
jgi:hypothetical protein